MLTRFMHIALIIFAVLICTPVCAQLPLIQEAEDCVITCKEGQTFVDNIWARGRKPTPNFWGRAKDDSVRWDFSLRAAHKGLQLGVRYAYGEGEYKAHFAADPKNALRVILDGKAPMTLSVPDTGSFDIYNTVSLALPNLSAGSHSLEIISPGDTCRNIDTLILFEGKLDALPVILRKTIIAESPSKHFVLRVTPEVKLAPSADQIFREFERIYDYYSKYMGWEFPGTTSINIIEQSKWPSNATAFQNPGGVFFRAEVMATEQGNWTHEMIHQMYIAHFPGWFDEPSCRVLTTLVFYPKLFPPKKGSPTSDPAYIEYTRAGQDVLATRDKTYDGLEPILCALAVRYGPDFYSRFFHACAEAGAKKEIDFTPGRWLTRDEMMKLMSKVAGEDVTPLFKRWNGFAGAQP